MKTTLKITNFLIASILTVTSLNAQTVYNIKENVKYSASKIPTHCVDCIINLADDVTLTVDDNIYFQNLTFNGGKINVANGMKMTLWSTVVFNKVSLTFTKAAFETSANFTVNSSDFTFSKNSTAIIYNTVDMNASSMKFLDNSSFEATGGNFTLNKNSKLTAGDGTSKSGAFIKFNGANLVEKDNGYVSVAANNNYYFNWSNYNANGKSIKTTDNKINCGAGKNECSAPVVYGPATLNFAGVASSATLPIKLSAFNVKLNGSKAEVSWTTDMELNGSRFEIETSADGINWNIAGTVAANGNSSIAIKYNATVSVKNTGSVMFRLKMIDLDETYAYSAIKSLKIEAAVEMSIYPNPATDHVVINTKNGSTENMTIQLINQNGQIVKQINGNGKVTLSVTEFHTGNYYVRVADANGAAQTFKLLISK